jgi:hypothetical protein
MFLRTLVRVGIVLLSGVCMTRADSVNLDTTEAGLVDVQSKVNTSGIRYVKNSGTCETTPNVTQISGYIDIETNMSMVCLCALCYRCRLTSNTVVLVLRV